MSTDDATMFFNKNITHYVFTKFMYHTPFALAIGKHHFNKTNYCDININVNESPYVD